MNRKPTIYELEAILDEEPSSIEILPNGEVRALGGSEELRACPFCGGEAKLHYDSFVSYVRCDQCHALSTKGAFGHGFDAAEKWNHRPLEDELVTALEVMMTLTDDHSLAIHHTAYQMARDIIARAKAT